MSALIIKQNTESCVPMVSCLKQQGQSYHYRTKRYCECFFFPLSFLGGCLFLKENVSKSFLDLNEKLRHQPQVTFSISRRAIFPHRDAQNYPPTFRWKFPVDYPIIHVFSITTHPAHMVAGGGIGPFLAVISLRVGCTLACDNSPMFHRAVS